MKTKKLFVGFNRSLLMILWVLSFTVSVYIPLSFGWKLNHAYDRKKEQKYKKQIDTLCYLILSVWCLFILINLYLYGPWMIILYALHHIIYLTLTIIMINLWLNRSYRHNRHARNFLIVISIWNLLVYTGNVICFLYLSQHYVFQWR